MTSYAASAMEQTLGARSTQAFFTKQQALAAFAENRSQAQRHVWWMHCFIGGSLGLFFLARVFVFVDDWYWSRMIRKSGGHVEQGYDMDYAARSPRSYKASDRGMGYESSTYVGGSGSMRRVPIMQRIPRAIVAFSRKYLNEVNVPFIGLSLGELTMVAIYFAVMIGLLADNAHNIPPNPIVPFRIIGIANRAGLMCFGSLPFQVLLSCRISFVGFLMGVPYDRVQFLHRWVGRSTLLLAITHATCKLIQMDTFSDHSFRRFGLGAFIVALFLILASHRYSMRAAYEVFAYVHIAAVISFIVLAWLHQPSHKYYLVTSIAIWVVDRFLRWARVVLYNGLWRMRGATRTEATLRLLSHDTTRLELYKPDFPYWKPGAFAFVSTPGLTVFPQSHPFTIASRPRRLDYTKGPHADHGSNGSDALAFAMSSPKSKSELLGSQPNVVFLIRARRGWTRTLHNLAQNRAFPSIPVLIDGPYDSSPVIHSTFDTVLLFAGGAGISWTLPMLTDLIEQHRKGRSVVRRAIWVCVLRHYVNYDWFFQELETIMQSGGQGWVDVRIHYTTSAEDVASVPTFFRPGRPNITAIIENAVQEAQGRTFVGVSGPQGPSDEVRRCVRDLTSPWAILKGDIRGDIYFHNELFGW